ncbi:histidinol-phosphate aminotransferase family protein [Chloroflexales bacterium ZM16-3]|nr:histidinol-phosphate aminotransferase family protein [Chloroflexales bacterium ZM16-3]
MIAHGALDHAELAALGLEPEGLIDFSSNLNPFGPPAAVGAALAALDPAPYPDRSCRRLRLALAERHGCAPDAILPGNGANELIHLIARALLRPGDVALVVGPTFGEYAHACQLAGAQLVELRAHQDGQFLLDTESLSAAIVRARPRLTWLCAPNNPTGVDLSDDAILSLAETCAAAGGLLVLDRAYRSFLPLATEVAAREPAADRPPVRADSASAQADAQRAALLRRDFSRQPGGDPLDAAAPANLLRLYSLTKSYAIAGLRLGYLLADAELIARVAAYQPAWSVSSAAQAAGLAALGDLTFLPTSLPQIWACSDALRDGLIAMRLPVHRADLPFMLVRTGDGAATRAALLRLGCVVRDCASFGLPAWVRVSPRRPEENARLLTAWGTCI